MRAVLVSIIAFCGGFVIGLYFYRIAIAPIDKDIGRAEAFGDSYHCIGVNIADPRAMIECIKLADKVRK